MASTFFGLNIALQGLYSSRTGLDVSFNNVANINSRGYSRQVIEQKATTPISLKSGAGMLGTGSEVYNIKQMRDFYLDKKYWSQNSVLGENRVKNSSLSQIEGTFDSQADENFTKVLNNFYDSVQNLNNSSGDQTNLTIVRQDALTLTKYFNDMSQKLQSQQENLNFNVKSTVDKINSFAVQIQSLNKQIFRAELDGRTANTLRDSRAVLIDDLSALVNVDVNEDENGRLTIDLNGHEFINHDNVKLLETRERKLPEESNYDTPEHFLEYLKENNLGKNYGIDTEKAKADDPEVAEALEAFKKDFKKYSQTNTSGLVDVYWTNSDEKLDVSSYSLKGELKGYLEIRDGNNNFTGIENGGVASSVNYKGIPHYLDELNQFAKTFAKLMNEGISYNGSQLSEKGGFANGYGVKGETGIGLFALKDADGNSLTGNILSENGDTLNYDDITASNFSISKEVSEDAGYIATRFDKNSGESDNSLVQAINGLRHNNGAFSQGEISDYMTALFEEVAINKKQADTFEKSQNGILMSVENQRLEVSGVDMNEETANWVQYQQVYTMACKMISVMDEIYDTTINKLGIT